MRNNTEKENGFTLIEILISISIVTILVGLLYGTFRSTVETSEAIDRDADPYRVSRIVFYQLTKDLTMFNQDAVATSTPVSTFPGSQPLFGALQIHGESRSLFIDGANYPNDAIAFVSLARPPVLQGFSVLDRAEISYSISEGSLMRNTRFRNKPVKNEVGDAVLGINFRYFESQKKEWLDEWDPSATTGIPLAIEVTLILKGHLSVKERTFKTAIGLPSMGIL